MSRVIWTAEIGSCHQGDKSLAHELIRQAKWAGATIAKFQLGWQKNIQEAYGLQYDERRNVDGWAEDLAKWCADLDIEFMASIWSHPALEIARSVGMKRYKIAHQVKDEALVDAICHDGKGVFWSMADVSSSLAKGYKWGEGFIRPVFVSAEYPSYKMTSVGEGNGYSSHMHGIADALIAVSRGADFIEKHMTLYKYSGFPKDASFALVPSEFKQMVEIGEEIARLR